MKVSEQCGIAASKINKILGLIRRTIMYKEKQLIVPVYKAMVRFQVWNGVFKHGGLFAKKCIVKLERIQRRAAKMSS